MVRNWGCENPLGVEIGPGYVLVPGRSGSVRGTSKMLLFNTINLLHSIPLYSWYYILCSYLRAFEPTNNHQNRFNDNRDAPLWRFLKRTVKIATVADVRLAIQHPPIVLESAPLEFSNQQLYGSQNKQLYHSRISSCKTLNQIPTFGSRSTIMGFSNQHLPVRLAIKHPCTVLKSALTRLTNQHLPWRFLD